ncbi:hypothetical protein M0L20_00595 [Spirosoma sp. RP8]|uniref:BcpO-related WXXGXW repeat protein n=1 Tax=Spirosoma liriopis TaxID=2937440 RepID=A0ABT0HDT6_9BACT|nr:DUF6600 domain-containing protein [Spirosoma liriopis]MCK8490324.1 hypothetical protein [Spirosoma liriopis]
MTILKTIKLLGLVALLALSPSISQKTMAQPGVSVPVESFYDELAPYGQWTQYPGYGDVWMPNAGPDFQPYATGGHWVVTEYGNTWVSDYAWGWAPFHYGRWIYDPGYGGWLWIPGTDWGPAWVAWRSGGGYYGWAPLAPGMNVSININIPAPYWTFVPEVYIASPRVYSYCVPRPNVVNIYQSTTIINNVYRTNNRVYAYGPPRADIERVTRRSVPVYRVDNLDRPGRSVVGNGSVGFYRPDHGPAYRQDYGRNGRFNNDPRPEFNGNNASGRGWYNGDNTTNRDYNRNNVPGRGTYNGNGTPDRGYTRDIEPNREYNGSFSPNRRGSFNGSDANGAIPGNNAAPNRSFESNRGTYRPAESGNNAPQGGFPQSPNRSYERPGFQAPSGNQSTPGGRESGFSRMNENRGSQPQFQQRNPEPNPQGNVARPGGFQGGGRGPR